MSGCTLEGCGRAIKSGRGWCYTHYSRWLKTGVIGGPIKAQAPNGSGYTRNDGRVVLDIGGVKKMQHVAVAEAAFGGPLPAGAEVHHVDENPSNNAPSNLVICPDAAYHKLLHQRQRAFDACGRYDWRRCHICKQYDDPKNMWVSRKKAHHRACDAARARVYKATKKGTPSV